MAAGRKTGGGSRKGSPNKNTKALKDMILAALDQQEGGGVEYLKRQAIQNPVAFIGLLGKVLPTQIQGDASSPLVIKISKEDVGI